MVAPLFERDPRQLGGYWLAARLGAGGQGVVYEGYDAHGNRVAVKALHADAVDEAFRNGLRKEVETLQRVASFCTARVIAADLDHLPPYIVSEYVPGPDLQSWVKHNGGYGTDELYRLAIGIATALSSIHRAGVVHRDLKPANVLLGPDGPRVIDFGIAKTEEMSRSATGQLKGTPRWMAPELFRGYRATPAVDVWAWAALVLFAATGRPPFDGDTLPILMHQITTDRPDTGVLTEPLRGLVKAALSQDPAERPAPEEILVGLIGGETRNPLEAGKQAAARSVQPSMTLPPSLAELAEQVYGRLGPHTQEAVPRILLRMVLARPNADDVLRAVAPSDFTDGETDQNTVQRVLNAFGEVGLIRSVEGNAVGLSTPALLRAWLRMRSWVEAERDGLNTHQALADAARRWNVNGRRQADLLQGSTLEEALSWASTGRRQLTLNLTERAFLDASVKQTRSRARTRTVLTVALATLLLVATTAGAAAGVQSRNLRKANATVSKERDSAIGTQLAAQAVQVRRTDPGLARRLVIAAASLAGNTPDTHHALLTVSSQWEQDIWAPPGTDGSWNQVYPSGGGPNIFWKRDQSKIIIADADTRKVRTVNLAGAPLSGMDLTLDGGRMLTLQSDGTMALWDLAKGTPSPLPYKHPTGAGLWLSPTGAKLIRSLNGQITVLETATGRELFRTKGKNGVWGPTLSPDERYMVIPLETGKKFKTRLAWWDLTTGKEVRGPYNDPNRYPFSEAGQYLGTTFSPDGRFLATRIKDVIVVLDAHTREIRTTLSVPDKNSLDTGLDFSRDGNYIASDMTLWSTETGTNAVPHLRYTPDAMCHGTRFSRDGTSLRCVDDQDRIRSIDVSGFTRQLRFAELSVNSTISQNGTTLAVRVNAKAVQIWDTATGTRRAELNIGHPVGDEIALSPNGGLLGLAGKDGTVEIWDVRSRARLVTVNAGPPPLAGRPLPSFSPDGKAVAMLVSTKPSVLRFYDTATGRQLGEARASKPAETVFASDIRIVWSKDGHRVISASDLGVVEFPSGKTVVAPGALGAPVVSRSVQALNPQGVVATVEGVVNQRSLIFWSAKDLKQKGNPIRLPEGKTPITALSPDGRLAATADSRGRIDIWDVEAQRRIGLPLTGHTVGASDTVIQSLAFSPDGTRVYSVGQDDAKLVTHVVAPKLLKEELCKKTGPLTEQEWATYVKHTHYRKTC